MSFVFKNVARCFELFHLPFSINSNHHHKTDTYLHFTTMNNCYHETIFLTRTTCTFPHVLKEKHNNIFSHFLTLTTESCFCTRRLWRIYWHRQKHFLADLAINTQCLACTDGFSVGIRWKCGKCIFDTCVSVCESAFSATETEMIAEKCEKRNCSEWYTFALKTFHHIIGFPSKKQHISTFA